MELTYINHFECCFPHHTVGLDPGGGGGVQGVRTPISTP